MSIQRSWLTSCLMISIGKSGARSWGPMGWSVPGWTTGGSGAGRSAWMLYHRLGRSFSSRTNLVCATGTSFTIYGALGSTGSPEGGILRRRFGARRSAGLQGPARLFGGVAVREVTKELVPDLPCVGLLVLRAIRETQTEESLGSVLPVRGEIDRLPVSERRALEVARRVVRLADPELRRRDERVRRIRLDELLEIQHGLTLLALVPVVHPTVEQRTGRAGRGRARRRSTLGRAGRRCLAVRAGRRGLWHGRRVAGTRLRRCARRVSGLRSRRR